MINRTVLHPARKRYILRSDTPGDPTEMIKWAALIEDGTQGKVRFYIEMKILQWSFKKQ